MLHAAVFASAGAADPQTNRARNTKHTPQDSTFLPYGRFFMVNSSYAMDSGAQYKNKATSKNVISVKTQIYTQLKLLDSCFRGSDRLGIIRGCYKNNISKYKWEEFLPIHLFPFSLRSCRLLVFYALILGKVQGIF
jgi:hypothetical protein